MIMTTGMLDDQLASYGNARNKISRMVSAGELYRVRRGLYETERDVDGRYLAGCILGPSYISFESALSDHGLIPEAVVAYTSATCKKRKTRCYTNIFGRYEYRDVPIEVFPLGLELMGDSDHPYWIASAEKALCDTLYKLSPVTSMRDFENLLFDDLRIDEDLFDTLNADDIYILADHYHSRNVTRLATYLERSRS